MDWYYDKEIRIKKLEIPPYDNNCYFIACPQTDEAVIVDAPGKASLILPDIIGLNVRYIIMTHAHGDHTGALKQLKNKIGAPVAIHPAEAMDLPVSPDIMLNNGQIINIGTVSLTVIHTPGHTPGSVCLLTGRHLFSGDTLFPGGPGNSPTPIAFQQIVTSLKEKIFILSDDTHVYPGHGKDTVLGKEKREFAAFSGRPHNPNLCGDVVWLNV
jgi:hydroxyacylglutathione hydrolase